MVDWSIVAQRVVRVTGQRAGIGRQDAVARQEQGQGLAKSDSTRTVPRADMCR